MIYTGLVKEKAQTGKKNIRKKHLHNAKKLPYTADFRPEGESGCLQHYWDENASDRTKTKAGAYSLSSGIVQRKLFIRSSRNVLRKNDSDMTQAIKIGRENKKDPAPIKKPQYVAEDPGYTEITGVFLDGILEAYGRWRLSNGIPLHTPEDAEIIRKKIVSMIKKTVESAKPNYELASETQNTAPRFEEGTKKEVSYYFDSWDEFFQYLFLSSDENKGGDTAWMKLNVVNAGAGDAIVMMLPRGYLIVDMGTDLNILINYLALRKNKRNGSEAAPRGIPLIGNETCIVITHNHTDHKGCKVGRRSLDKNLRRTIIIGYKEYQEAQGNKDDRYQRLTEFLESGNFNVYELGESGDEAGNRDSLVIGRRIGDSEAVILSGDQEPDRLVPVVEGMGEEGTVSHLFVKVSHHGSCENNNAVLMNAFSRLGNSADFVISSQNLFEHPTAGMFLSGPSLYRQGTQLQYSAQLPEGDTEIEDANEIRNCRVFYTANLNSKKEEIDIGSVAYKSNGEMHAVYSKRYTDISGYETAAEEIESDRERQAIFTMLQGIVKEDGKQGDILYRITHLSEFEQRENDVLFLHQIHNYSENTKMFLSDYVPYFPEIFPNIFYALNEEWQYYVLNSLLQDISALNLFMDRLDISRLGIESKDLLIEFVDCAVDNIELRQPFFDVVMRFGDWNKCIEIYEKIIESGTLEPVGRFLHAAFSYAGTDVEKMVSVFWESLPADSDEKGEILVLLDREIIFEILHTFDSLEEKAEFLSYIPEDKVYSYWSEYILSPYADPSEFLEFCENEEMIQMMLDNLNIQFFLKAYRDFPEKRTDTKEYLDAIREQKKLAEEAEEVEESLMEKIEIALEQQESVSSDWLLQMLKEMNLGFCTFIKNITGESLKKHLNACLSIVKMDGEERECVNAAVLLEACYACEECFTTCLTSLLQNIEEPKELIQYLLKSQTSGSMVSAVQNKCYHILAKWSFFQKLHELGEDVDQLVDDDPMLLAGYIRSYSNIYGVALLRDWTNKEDLKAAFYSRLSMVDPELTASVFMLHLSNFTQEARSLFWKMEIEYQKRILKSVQVEEALDMLKALEVENAVDEMAKLYNLIAA